MFMSRNIQALVPGFTDRRAQRDRRAAIRHQEAMMHALMQHQPVFELDLNGVILSANPGFCSLFGTIEEKLVGRPHATLLTEVEARGDMARDFLSQLARGIAAEAQLRHAANGRELVLHVSALPVAAGIEAATSASVLVLARDITDLAQHDTLGLRAREALESVSVAVMTVDRDFVVTGVNRATQELLRRHEASFRKVWPTLNVDRIVGMNIDTFHRNPQHQRRMLADESMLPHQTDITVGDLKFRLNVSASHSKAGVYDGNILEWMDVTELRTQQGQLAAMDRSQAIISFDLSGNVLEANENFLKTIGYRLEEIKGQHHSMFVDAQYRQSAEYRAFWERLGRGEFDAGQYKRIAKGGAELWLQASYNPIFDGGGKPFKVVKYAADITAQKKLSADHEGQIAAIGKSQGVISFDMTGKVLDANEKFLAVIGYRLEEVRGQHHSMFVEPAYRDSFEYRAFWEKLGRGEFDEGRYMRLGKGGKAAWIQASYNPILDPDGKPFKVVKYASDITAQVLAAKAQEEAVAQTEIMVASAQRNEFGSRIPLDGKDGSIGRLCGGVNSMVDTLQAQHGTAEALKNAVAETGSVVAAAQANDLSKRIDMTGKSGEIAQLCTGVNGMIDTMSGVLATMSESCGTISVAAREIAMGNTDLSQRTEEQASSLEETSASLEQLTSTVRQNADNAQQANKLACSASEIAIRGGTVVTEVVHTMDGITQSSRKISDIIGVIDEIAFQTNILALNAAVEAARAGEQGRGFAVVAAEVRSLAQRSANAAKEIKALISDSVQKVDNGSKLVASAGTTMDEIVGSVKRVTDIMAEISAASQEQSSGLDQVNTAVSQMDKITQQNAALVEEAAAAAKSMEEQTDTLQEMLDSFVLAPGSQSASHAPAVRTPAKPASAPAAKFAAKPEKPAAKRRAVPKAAADADDWKEF